MSKVYAVDISCLYLKVGFRFDIFARKDSFSFVDNVIRAGVFFLVTLIDVVTIRKD